MHVDSLFSEKIFLFLLGYENDSQFPHLLFTKILTSTKNRDSHLWSMKISGLKPLNGIDILMANWCCSLNIETSAFAIYADPYSKL